MPSSKFPYPGTAYHIAWICSTRRDEIAALTLLDVNYGAPLEDRDPTAGDACTYTTGLMAGHKVVIVCMYSDQPQPFTADNIVHNMRYTFPNLRFAMLVGAGSAMPNISVPVGFGFWVVVVSRMCGSGMLLLDVRKVRRGVLLFMRFIIMGLFRRGRLIIGRVLLRKRWLDSRANARI
jgi:hypothetical protein